MKFKKKMKGKFGKEERDEDDEKEEKSMKDQKRLAKALAQADADIESGEEGGEEETDRASLGASIIKGLEGVARGISLLVKGDDGSDETTALLHDGSETAFLNPRDSKGAKHKKKITTHEAAELTGQESADREDDAEDEGSMTVRSPSGPGGAEGGANPTKRRRHTGLPDASFGMNRSRSEEEEDVEKGVEGELMGELAEDENFVQVVEASKALETLTNVMVKSMATLAAQVDAIAKAQRKIRKSQRSTAILLKGIATGDIEKAVALVKSKREAKADRKIAKGGDGAAARFTNGNSRASHTADPGVVAFVDGKPMRIAGMGSRQVDKSKGFTSEEVQDIRERLVEAMNQGVLEPAVLERMDSQGPVAVMKSLEPSMRKSLGLNYDIE